MADSAFQAGNVFGAVLVALLIFAVIAMGIVSIVMAFVRRTTGWIVTAIVLSVLGAGGAITGAVVGGRVFGKIIAAQTKPKSIVSDDGRVRLTIPGLWIDLPELHGAASLRVGNKGGEEYAIVLSEEEDAFDGTLDEYAKFATDRIVRILGASAEVGPIEAATAGVFTARRCRLAGKVSDVGVVYHHYSIETPNGLHQLIMWTVPKKEFSARKAFARVAASFQIVTPPESGPSKAMTKRLPRTPRKGTVEERLRDILVEEIKLPAAKVKPEARFKEDLGADELDFVELVMATEEEFEIEIRDDDAEKLTTVRALVEYVSAKVK